MLFNTTQFFVFLAVVLALFYSAPRGWRKYILLAASYYFYASWNAKFIALLLTLTAIDYCAGLWLGGGAGGAGAAAQGGAGFQPGGQPGVSGLLQVLQFPGGQPGAGPGAAAALFLPGDRAPAGHQLPHLPKHVVRGGCLPRPAARRTKPDRLRTVHLLLPATGGGTDCEGARFLRSEEHTSEL